VSLGVLALAAYPLPASASPAGANVILPQCPGVRQPIVVQTGSYSPRVANVNAPGASPRWEWWSSMITSAESVTSTGINLFNSGLRSSGNWSFTFFASGHYRYHSTNGAQTGAIEVPLCLRGPQRVNRSFPIVFGSRHHRGWVSDIEVQRRGQRRWHWASYGNTGTYLMFDTGVAGRYQFRARLRRTRSGQTGRFSAPQGIRIGS
jgi:hypothetical protein